MNVYRTRQIIGILVIVQAALLLVPQAILGAAIDWPNSLDFLPAQALPLIAENISDVRLGYGIYLAYSMAWIIVGPLIVWVALGTRKTTGILCNMAIGLICASALARAIGIIRWLTASTFLASEYSDSSDATAATIELIQYAINSWGGAIGEILGVSLFTVGWLVVTCILIVRNDGLPNWLGWLGFLVAPILASPVIELFGMTADIFVSTLSIHLWLFAVGGVMMTMGESKKPAG